MSKRRFTQTAGGGGLWSGSARFGPDLEPGGLIMETQRCERLGRRTGAGGGMFLGQGDSCDSF